MWLARVVPGAPVAQAPLRRARVPAPAAAPVDGAVGPGRRVERASLDAAQVVADPVAAALHRSGADAATFLADFAAAVEAPAGLAK